MPKTSALAAEEDAAQHTEDKEEHRDDDGGVEQGFVESASRALDGVGVSAEGTADRGLSLLQQDDGDQYDGGDDGDEI